MTNVLNLNTGTPGVSNSGEPLSSAMLKIMAATNGIGGKWYGPTPPGSASPYEDWVDTSTNPPTWRIFDGLQWVPLVTVDIVTHIAKWAGDVAFTTGTPTMATRAKLQRQLAIDGNLQTVRDYVMNNYANDSAEALEWESAGFVPTTGILFTVIKAALGYSDSQAFNLWNNAYLLS